MTALPTPDEAVVRAVTALRAAAAGLLGVKRVAVEEYAEKLERRVAEGLTPDLGNLIRLGIVETQDEAALTTLCDLWGVYQQARSDGTAARGSPASERLTDAKIRRWRFGLLLHWILSHDMPGLSQERMESYLAKVSRGDDLDKSEVEKIKGMAAALRSAQSDGRRFAIELAHPEIPR